jgi:multidrug efflux pump subunit AcrA (membrane-fusion protein)
LLIPNAALRVLPDPKSVVPDQRAAYRALTDVKNRSKQRGGAAAGGDAKKAANKRMVWVNEGKLLRYFEITIGENNDQHTEILEGPLKAGDRVVSGITSE